jgi:lipid A oxidase
MRLSYSALALTAVLGAAPAHAEWQGWVYGGQTFTHDGYVHYYPTSGPEDTIPVSWDGKGFTMPIYYGVRLTRWFDSNPAWGVQVDFNHIKTYADLDGTEAGDTFDTLEFTDGLNIATIDAVYRWQNLYNGLTPYVGAGVGVTVPHVEVSLVGAPEEVLEYQLAGYSVVLFGGAEYQVWNKLSVFGEYKMSFAHVDADLGPGVGESITADTLNHHINFGLSYKFGD